MIPSNSVKCTLEVRLIKFYSIRQITTNKRKTSILLKIRIPILWIPFANLQTILHKNDTFPFFTTNTKLVCFFFQQNKLKQREEKSKRKAQKYIRHKSFMNVHEFVISRINIHSTSDYIVNIKNRT